MGRPAGRGGQANAAAREQALDEDFKAMTGE
jgi:hypothetical protein